MLDTFPVGEKEPFYFEHWRHRNRSLIGRRMLSVVERRLRQEMASLAIAEELVLHTFLCVSLAENVCSC